MPYCPVRMQYLTLTRTETHNCALLILKTAPVSAVTNRTIIERLLGASSGDSRFHTATALYYTKLTQAVRFAPSSLGRRPLIHPQPVRPLPVLLWSGLKEPITTVSKASGVGRRCRCRLSLPARAFLTLIHFGLCDAKDKSMVLFVPQARARRAHTVPGSSCVWLSIVVPGECP